MATQHTTLKTLTPSAPGKEDHFAENTHGRDVKDTDFTERETEAANRRQGERWVGELSTRRTLL